jgi:lipopolysaccharide transport system permease protein
VRREFDARYRHSLLGASWAVLQPLAMIVIYTVVFSRVMHSRLPGVSGDFAYSIYLCAGVLTWGLFAEITGRAQNVFLEQANLLKKVSFPRLCLPVIVVASAVVNFVIIFGLFTAFLILVGAFPGWAFVALLPVLAVEVLLAVGLGVTLGVLNVFFRDVGPFYAVVLQFWFWLTPIVYPASILPQWVQPWMCWNPMAQLVGAYQRILVEGAWPEWKGVGAVALLAIVLCLLGWRLFRVHAGEMVDEL